MNIMINKFYIENDCFNGFIFLGFEGGFIILGNI